MEMEKVKLSNLQHGVVIDMFDEEFSKVLRNITDDNVKPDATREICIKIQIKPDKTRQTAATKIDVTSKLAPVKSSDGMMFIGTEDNEVVAYEDNYNQQELGMDKPGIYRMAEAAGGQ